MIKNIINLIARILLSIVFITSGFNKITNFEATVLWMEKYYIPGSLLTPAIFFEILAALFVVFGYQAKITSLLLCIFCFSTAIIFHNDLTDQMQVIDFMKNISIAGGFLFVFLYGPGDISIDKKIK